jgi:type II secretory pathway component PulK
VRGSTLIAVLLLMALLLTLGMAMVNQSASAVQASTYRARAAAASALAWAGLNEARAKLGRDVFFPPRGGDGQQVFAYSEIMTDLAGRRVGSYTVRVDTRFAVAPGRLVRLESEGLLGDPARPLARRRLRLDLDRENFKVLRFLDEGCP